MEACYQPCTSWRPHTALCYLWEDRIFMNVLFFTGKDMSDITCCNKGAFRPASEMHPACLPITIPADDSFYNKYAVMKQLTLFIGIVKICPLLMMYIFWYVAFHSFDLELDNFFFFFFFVAISIVFSFFIWVYFSILKFIIHSLYIIFAACDTKPLFQIQSAVHGFRKVDASSPSCV